MDFCVSVHEIEIIADHLVTNHVIFGIAQATINMCAEHLRVSHCPLLRQTAKLIQHSQVQIGGVICAVPTVPQRVRLK